MADNENPNDPIIKEFRTNSGKVGGWFEGQTLLLLHHKGAKTGTERVNPLVYLETGASYAIFASAAGAQSDPQWFRNLLASPDVTAEIGTETVRLRARVATEQERPSIVARQTAVFPMFADYEAKAAPREIPVVILDPVA
jgi:deazaflavin-dependent oxidoreductase (nitroreductase family)